MIDLQAIPSSLLKTIAALARWALVMVVAAWVVFFVLWGALQWIIVPRIGEFRPLLESRASAMLGVSVRIASINANTSATMPSFELTDVQLVDAQGRTALRLPRVLATLSPRSLLQLGFEQLYIDQPELDIRRGADGKIRVAGLDFGQGDGAKGGAADWFFSQAEFVIHNGQLHWTDELRPAPTLTLTQVGLVVRHQGRHHNLRLEATPPPAWGAPFSLKGQLVQPLLTRHNGYWPDWQGQLYGQFSHVDLSELRRYASLGVDLHQGRGALTVWADVSQGAVQEAVADVALDEVTLTLGANLEALQLKSVRGRLGARPLATGFEFSSQGLTFDTEDGLHWPGGNVQIKYQGADAKTAAQGTLKADKLDLGALSQIAHRLPLEPAARAALAAYAPKGVVDQVQASWQGPLGAPTHYEVKGAVSALDLTAVAHSPGIKGAQIEFDFNQSAGKARVQVQHGALHFPTIFDDPLIPVTQLSFDAHWQVKGEHLAVQLPQLKFSNADAQGEAQLQWESAGPLESPDGPRSLGLLDLQGTLSRADGTRVYRYLPNVIAKEARDYVRDALQAGTASGVKFKVKGDLAHMPFEDPSQGEFKISADIKNATYAFVPRSLQRATELPWPALVQLSGVLVIDRLQLQVKAARARLGSATGPQVSKIEAHIPQLNQATVAVSAEARGGLGEMLGLVNHSPVNLLIGRALAQSSANGSADLKLKLSLPLSELEKSTVQGSVTLGNNELQITPESPKMARARGVVNFTELGFTIPGAQARMLGGDIRLEGGSVLPPPNASPANGTAGASIVLRASGTATAEGLRQAQELGFIARLAQHASGSAAYHAVLGFRRGEPELLVTSTLQGLALALPAPLIKSAEQLLPFKLETALLRDTTPPAVGASRLRDQLTLDLGRLASVVYIRDISGPEPRVLRGSMAVGLQGQETAPLPESGVVANLNFNRLDLDAWDRVLSQTAGQSLTDVATAAALRPSAASAGQVALSYLPNSLAIRTQALTLGGRTLHNVVVGGSREGLQWRANLEARELNGYLEYRQSAGSTPGRVFARLARLTLAPGAANDVEALLSTQPVSIPALDIVVDDFELRGKRLGRVEIEALNRGVAATASDPGTREWRLNKFNISNPDATFLASGNWASLSTPGAPAPRPLASWRTVMNFKLDIADSGALLTRLGMKDLVRKGNGKMAGQVAWLGSPFTLDYPSMTGAFSVNVENGQFLKADPGIAKLLGVLSLQALPRRLALDFRDVFTEGFAFDFFRGDIAIAQGIAKTSNLQMKGVNAAVLMEGSTHIAQETQDIKVVVVPELNTGTATLIASVLNPALGLGSFLAQLFLNRPLTEAATQEFHISGGWAEPKITKVQRAP